MSREKLLAWFILGIAGLLRVLLAFVNTEANDNHLSIIEVMAYERREPTISEISQAYHPKLYHAAVALVWSVAGEQSLSFTARTRSAQLFNAIAGMGVLVILWRFLRLFAFLKKVRLATFALLAFNPKLIAINAQATNDSLVIFLGSLAIYFGYLFFCVGGHDIL